MSVTIRTSGRTLFFEKCLTTKTITFLHNNNNNNSNSAVINLNIEINRN